NRRSRPPNEPRETKNAPQQVAESSREGQNHARSGRKSKSRKRCGRTALISANPRRHPSRHHLCDARGGLDAEKGRKMNWQLEVGEDQGGFRNEEELAKQIQREHRASGAWIARAKRAYFLLESGALLEPGGGAFPHHHNQFVKQRLLTNEHGQQQGEK